MNGYWCDSAYLSIVHHTQLYSCHPDFVSSPSPQPPLSISLAHSLPFHESQAQYKCMLQDFWLSANELPKLYCDWKMSRLIVLFKGETSLARMHVVKVVCYLIFPSLISTKAITYLARTVKFHDLAITNIWHLTIIFYYFFPLLSFDRFIVANLIDLENTISMLL